MRYLIDGYNILFRLFRAGNALQEQRVSLILELNRKIHCLNLTATIVFDAHHQPGEGSRSLFDSLEVCFTNAGETADDYILKEITSSQNPRQVIVVTSDKKLAWKARMLLAKSQTVEGFISALDKLYAKKLPKKRASKGKQQLSPLPIKSEEHIIAKRIQPPHPGKTAEESFDFYLYQFEKEFRELQKFIKPPKKTAGESDMKRWRRIFEKKEED